MDVGEVAQTIGWQGGTCPIVCVYLPLILQLLTCSSHLPF